MLRLMRLFLRTRRSKAGHNLYTFTSHKHSHHCFKEVCSVKLGHLDRIMSLDMIQLLLCDVQTTIIRVMPELLFSQQVVIADGRMSPPDWLYSEESVY